MMDLLNFLLKGILGKENFEISETNEDGKILYRIQTKEANKGLVIGKGGRMINALRHLLKIRATLEQKVVNLEVAD